MPQSQARLVAAARQGAGHALQAGSRRPAVVAVIPQVQHVVTLLQGAVGEPLVSLRPVGGHAGQPLVVPDEYRLPPRRTQVFSSS